MSSCSICGEGDHRSANCPELWHPEKASGSGGGDDDDAAVKCVVNSHQESSNDMTIMMVCWANRKSAWKMTYFIKIDKYPCSSNNLK